MATKLKMLKLLQETDGFAEINRRPAPPKPALYMMQLRPRTFHPALPKRKLPIRINPVDCGFPVKIVFLKPGSEPA
jgi:hypothetical protein